jgi:hypothetical protein
MPTVRALLEVEYETRDETSANATLMRIPGDLQIAIQEGRMGHAMTGVTPGSVRVHIVERSIE